MRENRNLTKEEREEVNKIIFTILKDSSPLWFDDIFTKYREIDTRSYLHDDYIREVDIKIQLLNLVNYGLKLNDRWQFYIGD